MKALAERLKQDEDKWGLTGLLHDADYELTKDRPAEHGIIIGDKARSLDGPIPDDVFEAIKFHNKEYTHAAESLMGWGIYICDELTGIVVACALVRPDKKLASVDADFVLRKMKQPSFAKGALRERIYLCEEKLNTPLKEFVKVCLQAMQKIAAELGL
ncbi:phosphohydrolase [Candidatus Gottesmanbacteria bacterium]|nr:phosphohydrolase [Candidatus Gottesmanbacteria bacterium]